MKVRPYAGPADLRAMQSLVQETWSRASRWHVGDLAWNRYPRQAREAEWPTRLWEVDGSVVAWGWARPPGRLDFMVHPRFPRLAEEVVGWFGGVARGKRWSAIVLETETHLTRALDEHGYRPEAGAPVWRNMARTLDDLPEPTLPAGYVARAMRGEDDVVRRTAVHKAAWELLPFTAAPRRAFSPMTADRYRDLMSTWPYRPELDWVIEAPNGEFVASCCIWLDDLNGVGELEPVGTHPDFRRCGLSRAVCLYALRALRQFGAREAIVYSRDDEEYPIPARLYRGLGFSPYASAYSYLRATAE
jgi:ribosomal protein S18 acetylase RimI-like enzyme